ncbi:MAG TPA: XRE family transcriptional regulator [Dehalococcoidia bacterium]|nr:XRE family transcriptional regulator [Dehalococcoidia bacterium]
MAEIGQKIKVLRTNAGISQQKLADMLGISRPAITQIESGERKVSSGELVKLSEILNTSVEQLVCLTDEPEVILQNKRTDRKAETPMRINVPQKNLAKFKEILLYILNKVGSKPNIGETVIYKLLYFMDFDFYEKYEEQLIGATYVKNHYGPTPLEFKKIVQAMINDQEIITVKNSYFDYPQTKYLPLRKAQLSGLKANEIELIDSVLNKLSDMNAAQISEYSHNDVPWLTTGNGGKIEYESVFYRTPLYSVREYT